MKIIRHPFLNLAVRVADYLDIDNIFVRKMLAEAVNKQLPQPERVHVESYIFKDLTP